MSEISDPYWWLAALDAVLLLVLLVHFFEKRSPDIADEHAPVGRIVTYDDVGYESGQIPQGNR